MNNYEMNLFYNKLYDEESRAIYEARFRYSLNRDYYQLMEKLWMINKDKDWDISPITERLIHACGNDSTEVIIFGAGNNGRNIFWELTRFSNIAIKFFLDNDISVAGQKWCGVTIFHPEEMKNQISNHKIILSIENVLARKEIKLQLEQYGVNSKNIIDPFLKGKRGIYSHVGKQYFDCPEISFGENEVFVDAGCCDGATIETFIKVCNNKCSRIYGFEPDTVCAQYCRQRFIGDSRIEMIEKGAWSEEGQVHFEEKDEGLSCITDKGTKTINVDTIDRICINDTVTYIKMDIEGAELEALKGSKCIIERDKPKLAICIYHKPEAVWEIPQLLMKYNPNYHFAIRHYHLTDYETVLYAW